MMATMRRVPSEQFFDLRGWQADHAEEYGEQPSMRVQQLQLDRPEQVGSHYHFGETNQGLQFDRSAAYGMRLDIPAGTAVRFEPGDT